MSRMLDLIRGSEVPANLMQSAARGSLSVTPAEMIEILVYLALHHKGLGQQAKLTLAGWDEKASLAAASDPATSPEVLGYFASPENLRMPLLPALAENTSVTEEALGKLASHGARSIAVMLLASARVMNSPALLKELQSNSNLRPDELAEVGKKLAALTGEAASATDSETERADSASEQTLASFLKENAAEVESDKDKPFQPIGPIHDELGTHLAEPGRAAMASTSSAMSSAGSATARAAPGTAAALAAAHARQHAATDYVERRDSALQKIAKLDIKARIALAIRGSKEDRSILIRDGTKVVALAVLESPKLSETEVEGFALQKNVLEAVLRHIPLKRRFAKNYNIMRNLVYNPRTPIDLSLGLMKGLLVHDLKNLSGNKEIPDTIRKMALRLFKQKMEKREAK